MVSTSEAEASDEDRPADGDGTEIEEGGVTDFGGGLCLGLLIGLAIMHGLMIWHQWRQTRPGKSVTLK